MKRSFKRAWAKEKARKTKLKNKKRGRKNK